MTAINSQSVDYRKCEATEIACWKDYYDYTPANIKSRLGLHYRLIGPLMCFAMAGHDILALNRALIANDKPLTKGLVQDVIAFYKHSGVKRMAVQLPFLDEHSGNRNVLMESGFIYNNRWVKLNAGFNITHTPLHHKLTVRKATEQDRDVIAAIIACSFGWSFDIGHVFASPLGRKNWHYYLALEGKAPISASSLHISEGVASLCIAATPPYARGRNAQQAQIQQRIQKAKEAGCWLLQTETGEDFIDRPNVSFKNMVKHGMQPAYFKDNYVMNF